MKQIHMSEDDKLAYIHYVGGCLGMDRYPLPIQLWRNLYYQFKCEERSEELALAAIARQKIPRE